MRILIAEDQAASALFLRRSLERMGHEVTVAVDGEEAWQALQAEAGAVPLLISDWMMPRLDGPELCRRVRAATGPGYTYVILLTAKNHKLDRLEGLRAGADDFLTKPPDPDELAVRLEIAGRILAVHQELARQNARLVELAAVDELTGVKNRRRFREDLQMHYALAARRDTPLSVVMIDVDHFKRYNDEFGHPAGDEVLRSVAGALRDGVRDHDVVARYGGEEFVVLLPSTGANDAVLASDRLRGQIEGLAARRPLTASFGVACSGPEVPDAAGLIEAADQALYASKRDGRNRVTLYTPADVFIEADGFRAR